eukprot:COSAG02_NODE_1599_length_11754_cov_6.319005_8_plen_1200_part_00
MALNAAAPQHPPVYTIALLLRVLGLAVDRAEAQCMDGLCGIHGDCAGSAAACTDDPDWSHTTTVHGFRSTHTCADFSWDSWADFVPDQECDSEDYGTPADHCPVACGRLEGCCKCHAGWAGVRCQVETVSTVRCDADCGVHGACVGSATTCADDPHWTFRSSNRDLYNPIYHSGSFTCADFSIGGFLGPRHCNDKRCADGAIDFADRQPPSHYCAATCPADGCCECEEGWATRWTTGWGSDGAGTGRCEIHLSNTPGTCDQAVHECGAHGVCVGSAAACTNEPGWSARYGTAANGMSTGCEPNAYYDTPGVIAGDPTASGHPGNCSEICNYDSRRWDSEECVKPWEHCPATCGREGCCECTDDGWYGLKCQLNDDVGTCDQTVAPINCGHHGTCVGSATLCGNGVETEGCCECTEGWYGLHCEFSTDPCSPYAEHRVNCGQHGTCNSACVAGSRDCALCVCEAGWYAGSSTSRYGARYECIACGVGKYSTAGTGQTSENVCIACSVNTTSREGSTSVSDCACNAGTYSDSGHDNTRGDACLACRAGMFSDTEGSTSCHACTAGQSAIAGSTSCSPCVAGFYNPSSGGLCIECDQGMTSESGAKTCAKVDCPDSSKPCTLFDGTRARGDSQCPEGFDIDTTDRNATHAAVVDAVTCEPCPQPRRCAGVGGACSYFSAGPMCNSCLPNHYPAGFFCAKCAESKLVAGVFAAVAFVIATLVFWLLSKEKEYKPPTTIGAAKHVANNLANPLVASGRRVAVAAGVQATTRSSGTVVTSICWPHFTFSMLPLQLPNVNWPELVKATATWLRSLVFLDVSVAAQPECFATGMDLVTKKLVRLGVSHAAFWLLVSVFFIFRCCGSRRAINASVIMFMMGHTYLLRSCLGTLHCIAPTSREAGLDENLGHLQSDIGIACDVRMTTMLEALCCSFAMVAITQRLNTKEFEPLHCGWLLTVGWMLVTLCRVVFWPIAQLSYMLPTLGLVGSVLYGLIIPKCLHLAVAQQMSNLGDAYHHDNGFISQYGYLVTRFKPEKWGSEFRILGRKTMLLFATTIFAESTGLATVTQLVALVFALVMQCRETPFAETGSKAASFGDYPGWSRPDKLEALSLVSQIGLVAVAPFASDERELVISILVLVCVALPAVYGTYVMLTEWKNGRRRKEGTKCRLLVGLCLLGTLCVVVGGGVVAFQGRIGIEEGSMSRFDW